MVAGPFLPPHPSLPQSLEAVSAVSGAGHPASRSSSRTDWQTSWRTRRTERSRRPSAEGSLASRSSGAGVGSPGNAAGRGTTLAMPGQTPSIPAVSPWATSAGARTACPSPRCAGSAARRSSKCWGTRTSRHVSGACRPDSHARGLAHAAKHLSTARSEARVPFRASVGLSLAS